MEPRAHSAVLTFARQADSGLSEFVARAVHRCSVIAACLAASLVFYVAVHVWGLLTCLYSLGKFQYISTLVAEVGLDDTVNSYGERQPLGAMEEAAVFLITALLVALLTGAIRVLREMGARDGLPDQLWRVTLIAAVRPRRVVTAIWRITDARHSDPRGAALLDVIWPLWLLSNVTVQVGDQLSAAAADVSGALVATRLELAAEIGFVILGVLLLWLVAALAGRLQIGLGASPPVWLVALGAVLLSFVVTALGAGICTPWEVRDRTPRWSAPSSRCRTHGAPARTQQAGATTLPCSAPRPAPSSKPTSPGCDGHGTWSTRFAPLAKPPASPRFRRSARRPRCWRSSASSATRAGTEPSLWSESRSSP